METAEHELIQKIRANNPQLKKLYKEHLELEKKLSKYSLYEGYSASTKLHLQTLKKQKLNGVDRMMQILANYKPHQ